MSTPDKDETPDQASVPTDDAPHPPTPVAERPVPSPPPAGATPLTAPDAPAEAAPSAEASATRATPVPDYLTTPASPGPPPAVTRTSVRPTTAGPGPATARTASTTTGTGSSADDASAPEATTPTTPTPSATAPDLTAVGAAPAVVDAPAPVAEPESSEPGTSRRRLRRSRPVVETAPAVPGDAGRSGGGVLRHLLGVVVGLVAALVATWLVVFGQSRILSAQAPDWDASFEPLGVVLVTFGVLLLAATLALGLWTPAVPLAGGAGAALVGVVYLYSPATMHAHTLDWFATQSTRGSVERATVATTSGTVFVVGALLLVAGLVQVAARRRQAAGA